MEKGCKKDSDCVIKKVFDSCGKLKEDCYNINGKPINYPRYPNPDLSCPPNMPTQAPIIKCNCSHINNQCYGSQWV